MINKKQGSNSVRTTLFLGIVLLFFTALMIAPYAQDLDQSSDSDTTPGQGFISFFQELFSGNTLTGAVIGIPEIEETLTDNQTPENSELSLPVEETVIEEETPVEEVPEEIIGEQPIKEETQVEEELIEETPTEEILPAPTEPIVNETLPEETPINESETLGTSGTFQIMAAPVAGNVTLNSTDNTNYTTENLTLYWDITDSDADDVKNITNWKLNGTSITVLNMPFENMSSSGGGINATKDYSGFENNGSEYGGIFWNATGGYDGKGAYEFKGVHEVASDDHINITDADELSFGDSTNNYPFSISAWIKTEDASNFYILQKGVAGTDGEYMFKTTGEGYLVFLVIDENPSLAYIGREYATGLANNTWYHVAATYDGGLVNTSCKIYMDGVQVDDTNYGGGGTYAAMENSAGSVYLGIEEDNYANGTIDEVMIFNRSLSADQIYALYINRTDRLSSDETSFEDNWSACITPNDGVQDGTEQCSSTLTISQCGSTIAADKTLTEDLICAGTGLTMGADNIILDCAGHTINYSTATATAGYGVNNSDGHNNITIKNCVIEEGNATTDYKYSIYFDNQADNGMIVDNNITSIGVYGWAVYIRNSSNNNITNNVVTTTGSSSDAIYLRSSANSNNVTDNIVNTTGDQAPGIYVEDDSLNNIIKENTITTGGTGGGNTNGIAIISFSNYSLISNNTITTNDAGANAIHFSQSSHSNITNNVLITEVGYGIVFKTSSDSHIVTDNNITTYGASGYGIFLWSTNNSILINNNISTNSTFSIYDISGGSANNTVIYNNSYGQINWTQTVLTANVSLSIGDHVFIQNNLVGLTDDVQALYLGNNSLEIEIRSLSYDVAPKLLKDGTRCDTTDACNISYDSTAGILSANISSFSNYTTQAVSYCDGNYNGSNWTINSSISCSHETIDVNGTITILDDSETAATSFNSLISAAYDLSGNATTITAAIPDLDKITPSQYTNDWDPDANHELYIVMDESEHMLQIFTDNLDNQTKYYYINMDNSESSGMTKEGFIKEGYDVGWGYTSGTPFITCGNESANNDNTFVTTSDGEGQVTCGNVSGWDSKFDGNFTVYWNISGSTFELTVDQSGAWIDKKAKARGIVKDDFTTFKNSSLISGGLGNLTLTNISLNLEGNLDIQGRFTSENTTIESQLTSNGSTNITFNVGSIININNSVLTGNGTSLQWGLGSTSSNYTITHNKFTFNGVVEEFHENLMEGKAGGLIYNNTFSNCTENANIKLHDADNYGINISSNTFLDPGPGDINIHFDGYSCSEGAAENNNFYGRVYLSQIDGNSPININLTGNTFYSGSTLELVGGTGGQILKNNNFSADSLLDNAAGGTNTMIYSNQFGEIKWADKTNLSVNTSLALGDKIYLADNNLSMDDNTDLVNLNSSAQLTYYNLNDNATHDLYKDGAKCSNTDACNITSDDGNTTVFQVSSFSDYTTSDPCGTTITTDTTLSTNYTCSGNAIIIGASDLTLDCAGYTINYSSDGTAGQGIRDDGAYDNVTIKNCNIYEGTAATDDKDAINLNDVNVTIENNTIITIGDSYGIKLDTSSTSNITSNIITAAGDGVHAIQLVTVTNSNFDSNTITVSGTGSHGFRVTDSSASNNFTNNAITISGASGKGIDFSESTAPTIVNNTINTNGSQGHAIYLPEISNANMVDNIINSNGDSAVGIMLWGGCHFAVLTNNTVTTTSDSALGIYYLTSSGSNLTNNTVVTSGSQSYGIYFSTSSDSNTLTDNTVNTNGSQGHGIYIHGSSSLELTNNTIITTNEDVYGIYLSSSSGSNILLNNNLSSNQSYEIYDGTGNTKTNYLIYNNSFGEIRWSDDTNNGFLKDMDVNVDGTLALGNNLFIGSNTIALNTTAFGSNPDINSSANITLTGLSFGSVNIIKRLENYSTDSTEIITGGTNCNGTSCEILSYSSNTLAFNTSYFSSFSGNENNAPSVTTPTITPTTAYTNDTLTANTTYTDPDGDAGIIYFQWNLNGTNIYNQTNTSIANGTTIITTLDPNNFSKNDQINVSVYANDGLNDSTTAWSTVLTIQNTAPNTAQIVLNATSASKYSADNLTCYANITDIDGDNVYANYTWYNGTELVLTGQSSTFTQNTLTLIAALDFNNTTEGQVWTCEVRGYDGTSYESDWTNSSNLTILSVPEEEEPVDEGGGDVVTSEPEPEAEPEPEPEAQPTPISPTITSTITFTNTGGDVIRADAELEEFISKNLTEETKFEDVLKEQGLLQEEIEEKIELERLKEQENLMPILTTKFFSFGLDIGINYSDESVSGRLLKSEILNPEELIIRPGETLEKELEIRGGISAKPKTIKVAFKSLGKIISEKEIVVQKKAILGTAVDVDTIKRWMDIYLVIPAMDGLKDMETYWLELSIHSPGTSFAELYGPFKVQQTDGFVFGQQLKYNPTYYYGNHHVKAKIIQNGKVVLKNEFDVDLGNQILGETSSPQTLKKLGFSFLLVLAILAIISVCIFTALYLFKKRKISKKKVLSPPPALPPPEVPKKFRLAAHAPPMKKLIRVKLLPKLLKTGKALKIGLGMILAEVWKGIKLISIKFGRGISKAAIALLKGIKFAIKATALGNAIIFVKLAKGIKSVIKAIAVGIAMIFIKLAKIIKTAAAWLITKSGLLKVLKKSSWIILTKLISFLDAIISWPIKTIMKIKASWRKKKEEREIKEAAEKREESRDNIEEREEKASELSRFILQSMAKGIPKERIKAVLLEGKWPQEIVEDYVESISRKIEKKREKTQQKEEKKLQRKKKETWEEKLAYVEEELRKTQTEGIRFKEEPPLKKKSQPMKKEIKPKTIIKRPKETRKEKRWRKKLNKELEKVDKELESLR